MSSAGNSSFGLLPLPKMSATRSEALQRLGIHSLNQALFHFPLRHEDRSTVRTIAESVGHTVRVEVTITHVSLTRKRRAELVVTCSDSSALMALRFLKVYPGQYQKFEALKDKGEPVHLFGEIRKSQFGLEMYHPKILSMSTEVPEQSLSPIYPITQGITQSFLSRIVEQALSSCSLEDTLPASLREKLDLMAWSDAIQQLHRPESKLTDLSPAWERIRFDELLAQQLKMGLIRRQFQTESAPVLKAYPETDKKLISTLPFNLTNAQKKAWQEISDDMARSIPMRRLLQGDVGSGKTVVAALAIAQCIQNGYQAAIMAPTDILANQHAVNMEKWLIPLGYRCALLTASTDTATTREVLALTEAGEIDCVIGTHALFYDRIQFHRLGLSIIDEQHRFGVDQRNRLAQKGKQTHQLLMTATPIPRSLAMTYLADADLSIIDERPPGRQPIKTKLIDTRRRPMLIDSIHSACQEGQQVYWVCPLIEESEVLALQTIEQTREEIAERYPDLRLGVVTGRLKPQEKQQVMDGFKAGLYDVLIATTVIEVGVDVPSANIIVIESAERFGLAQLHQLRGRVGRGDQAAVCVLLYRHPLSAMAKERLKILYETTDGFDIARRDMQLRGFGDYYGTRQSGLPLLRFADPFRDAHLIESAARIGSQMLDKWPDHALKHLQRYHHQIDETLKF